MTVFVGTSGWQYRDWRGVLYPEGVPQRRWLEEYARSFAAVENNAAFYRLPERATFADWRERTPEGFVMAVKASRYLTHIKRLKAPAEPVARLMDRAAALGRRLGPVLLQLPPNLRADPGLLDAALARFPTGTRVAVEPRHPSWWTDEVADVLAGRGAALCWADRGSRPVAPLWRTADWGYLRLHEGRARPFPSYGRKALVSWVERIAEGWPGARADVFVFFNNDVGGAAVRNAELFVRLAVSAGLETAGQGGRDSSHE
ncbi:DUF72 domain-containing protein [Streptomyces fradiae]|uniref:DUF72 domain-containing protein n=1 Tax=Streptomyces fradiae TaxID=1906 RepID=UPI0035197065